MSGSLKPSHLSSWRGRERVHFQGKYWQADNLPYYPSPCSSPIHRCCSRPIATIPSPMQRLAWRSVHHTESADASPHRPTRRVRSGQASPWHDAAPTGLCHGLFFVAKTRAEAHAVARENWRDTDMANGMAFMKSLGIDVGRILRPAL